MSTEKEYRKRPTVVVVIPFYNGADWVERAIKSVVAQTVQPDEFIIVNDGSKPEERAALGRLAEKYPFSIIDKENGGQGSARNAGVAASKSDFICLLDQDDYYLPHHIEDLVDALPENDRRFGFVYADLCIGDGDGNIIFSDAVKERGPHPKRSVLDLLNRDIFILPSASLVSRRAYEAVGGFDPQFMGYEDDDLFLRIFRSGYSNYWLDKSVTVWCIHGESTSYSIKMSRSRFKYFKKLTVNFPDNAERGLYYSRDCIIPRFGKHFIEEAEKAVAKKSPDTAEFLDMFREFQAIVEANEYVDIEYKKYLNRTIHAIQDLPIPIKSLSKYQDGLRQCYGSTSWKITRPFRLIHCRLKGLPLPAETIPYDDNEAHLKLVALWRSRSWKFCAPLRAIKRMFAGEAKQESESSEKTPRNEFPATLAR